MDEGLTRCPGCALLLPRTGWPAPDTFNASGECWERYGELSAYTLSIADPSFPHQFAVDAFAAQHVSVRTAPITTTFALVGLCLACAHGLSGRAVQRAHQAIAKTKRNWPRFTPPAALAALTVADVLAAAPADRDAALRRWAASVWAVWRDDHAHVRELIAKWLPRLIADEAL
jgi:hypothetical protein